MDGVFETQPDRTDLPLVVMPVVIESMIGPFKQNFTMLENVARVRMYEDFTLDEDTIVERCKDADAVMVIGFHCADAILDRLNPLPGRELTLKTYLHVRENMQVLYGFATDAERDIFLLLIERVSGIGPATAIAILGSLSVEQFKQAVVGGDVSGIARAKGVGKKTAERTGGEDERNEGRGNGGGRLGRKGAQCSRWNPARR